MTNLWDHDEPIIDCCPGINIPAWIVQDITPSDVAAIVEGGCNSGAYMPATVYCAALATMANHGDDVLQYLQDQRGELPRPPDDVSWSGLACFFLSAAVETWAAGAKQELTDALDDVPVED